MAFIIYPACLTISSFHPFMMTGKLFCNFNFRVALELALVDLRGVAILLGKCIGTLQKIAKLVIQHQLQQWYAD